MKKLLPSIGLLIALFTSSYAVAQTCTTAATWVSGTGISTSPALFKEGSTATSNILSVVATAASAGMSQLAGTPTAAALPFITSYPATGGSTLVTVNNISTAPVYSGFKLGYSLPGGNNRNLNRISMTWDATLYPNVTYERNVAAGAMGAMYYLPVTSPLNFVPNGATLTSGTLYGFRNEPVSAGTIPGTIPPPLGFVFTPSRPLAVAESTGVTIYGENDIDTTIAGEVLGMYAGTACADTPKIAVIKTVSQNPLQVGKAGQFYTITVDVTNKDSTAPINVLDVLPTGVTLAGVPTVVGGTLSGCPSTGSNLTGCALNTGIAAGSSVVITVPINVGSTATTGANTANATGGGDLLCATSTACGGTTPAVSVIKIIPVDEAITVAANSTGTTNVATNEPIPANRPTGSTYAIASSTCPGTPTVVSTTGAVSYTAPALGSCTVTYNVCAASPNQTVCAPGVLTINTPPVITVTKTASQEPLIKGQSGQYYTIKINVANAATTANITLTDALPAGITLSGPPTITGGILGACPSTGTTLTGCTILAGAAIGDIIITAPVDVGSTTAASGVTNTVTATGGGDTTCATVLAAAANCKSTVVSTTYTAPTAPASCPAPGTTCTPSIGFTSCVRIPATGATSAFTVPAGVTSINAKLWGAGGGGAGTTDFGGGGGGFTTGNIAVTPGDTLNVTTGVAGKLYGSAAGTFGGGGAGGAGSSNGKGGSGGGMSGIWLGTPFIVGNQLLIAGGGGGGSPGSGPQGSGGGGGLTGGDDSWPANSGRGGTQTAGGARATSITDCSTLQTAGSQFQGGQGASYTNPPKSASWEGGGGGGGGWFGGGGGRCAPNGPTTAAQDNGNGGGGSGYATATSTVTSPSTVAGNNSVADNLGGAAAKTTDPQYVAGIGYGGGNSDGCDGLVVLQYNTPPTLSVTKTVSPSPLVVGAANQSYSLVIAVANGPTTAPISIVDALPAGITTSGAITATGGTLSGCPAAGASNLNGCSIAAGVANGIITVTVPISVDPNATTGNNTASVTGGGATACTGTTCSGSATATVIRQANMTITKTDSKAANSSGSVNSYVITVSNAGPSPADGAVVSDIPSAGLSCPGTAGVATVSCSATNGAQCPGAAAINTTSTITHAAFNAGATVPKLPATGQLSFVYECTVN